MGGIFATLNPEKVLKEFEADYVCIGEGVESFPEFLRTIKDNVDIKNIKNIW